MNFIKLIFVILFSFASEVALCQVRETKKFYANGKIQSVTYKEHNTLVKELLYLPNGKIENEVNFKDGNLFGWQRNYDSSGKKVREFYLLGIDQVPHNLFFDTNDSSTTHNFIDVWSGKEINYYPTGTIESEGYIVNALEAGLWKYYEKNGSIREIIFHKTLKSQN
jgi:antitoxin component YwqK of YwqJK toxin-antitoxin module